MFEVELKEKIKVITGDFCYFKVTNVAKTYVYFEIKQFIPNHIELSCKDEIYNRVKK